MIDQPLQKQIDKLLEIVLENQNCKKILLGSPFPRNVDWYLGAGCICQSVWNHLSNKNPEDNIGDYDFIYYNSKDISKEAESNERLRIKKLFSSLSIDIDVVNEARVHTWFEEDFGKKIDQLKSCEDAINQWPTTATAIGVNKTGKKFNIYAPYGLNDLFGMIIRPNKPSTIKEVYEEKVKKWTRIWPNLKAIPWGQT